MSTDHHKRATKTKDIALAALRLFAVRGYAATSIEEIAAAAGMGKSTVYEYYTTKEALFVAAIMTGAELLLEDLHAIGRNTPDPMERLEKVSLLFVKAQRPEFAMESKLFVEVLSHALTSGGAFSQLRPAIQNIYQRVVRLVTDFILTGVSEGRLRPDIARDAERITINYLAFLDGIKMHALLAEQDVSAWDQIDFYLNQLARLITVESVSG